MTTYLRAHLMRDNASMVGDFEWLIGYRVVLEGAIGKGFWGGEVAATTKANGTFELEYRRGGPRQLALVVKDVAGRELRVAELRHCPQFRIDSSGRVVFDDPVDDTQLIAGDLIIREAEATGFRVTLGTGEAKGVNQGRWVTTLVDRDIFTRAAELLRHACESVLFTQLRFSLPYHYVADPADEQPRVVFDFEPNAPDVRDRRIEPAGYARPERLLLQAADNGAHIRMLFHATEVPLVLKLLAGALLFPFGGTDGYFAIDAVADELASTEAARRYFVPAGRPNIKVLPFPQPLTDGLMHARLLSVDSTHAMYLGSSFVQSYVDTHDHEIDAPIRGGTQGLPDHDVAVAVSGPAARELHDALQLLWETADPDDVLKGWPEFTPVGAGVPRCPEKDPRLDLPIDGKCSVQCVRTLSKGKFKGLPEGEKGILEAYLRAIAMAKDFIYLENQYFTNRTIGRALVNAMKARPDLRVIVVLNIRPDTTFYPWRQMHLIRCIRRDMDEDPRNPRQFGVFTRWTHEVANPATSGTRDPRSRMLPIYIHSKMGIVDDVWATVGSANLTGVSLESYWSFAGQFRGIEVNALLLDEEGAVVPKLRYKLWAEHLGYPVPNSTSDPDPQVPPDLLEAPSAGWLKLWSDRSAATLNRLKTEPGRGTAGMARVLPWPPDWWNHKTPRDHLAALGIQAQAVVPLKSTRGFDLETGEWMPGSKAKMDF